MLIIRIVDLAVERRRMESTLLGDPVIMRFFAHHEPFPAGDGRLYRQRYSDPPLNGRVLRAHGESRRRMPHLHAPPAGYHAQSVDVVASTSLDHLASNCFDFPDQQSV